jgi:hypothetical protein
MFEWHNRGHVTRVWDQQIHPSGTRTIGTEAVEMNPTIQRHQPPPPAADPIDPILDILNDPDLTMGEKLLRMEALFAHDSPTPPRPRLSIERVRPSRLNARVREGGRAVGR